MTSPASEATATYRSLFREREYRALFSADVVSQLGDQVAAVALAVLVYRRSQSPLLAALGYSLVFLPWILGGPMLAALAERLPPRAVLVGSDLGRAALVGLAAIPGMPLPLLGLLLLAAALIGPVFRSARSALLPQILDDDRYSLALSVEEVLSQTAQLGGFITGGALVLLLDPQRALGLNALSFALSAFVLRRGISPRPSAAVPGDRASLLAESHAGLRIVAGQATLRRPLLLAVIGATYLVVPEAIAPAYVAQTGGGPVAVGLLMGSVAIGSVLGAVLLARCVRPARRGHLMRPLAFAGTIPLLLIALAPPYPVALALLLVAGLCSAYNVPANAAFAAAIPDGARARAFGLAMTAMMGGQLVGVVAGGALAEVLRPTAVIAVAGAVGLVALLATRRDKQLPDLVIVGPAVHGAEAQNYV